MTTLSDRQVAQLVLGADAKTTSWKSIQAAARRGELKGRQVARRWRFLEEDVKDWISYRNGRRS